MKKTLIIIGLLLILATNNCSSHQTDNWQVREDFAQYFLELDVDGAFVLLDLNQETYLVHNPQRANSEFLPASTFKFFNSLVALETNTTRSIKLRSQIRPTRFFRSLFYSATAKKRMIPTRVFMAQSHRLMLFLIL